MKVECNLFSFSRVTRRVHWQMRDKGMKTKDTFPHTCDIGRAKLKFRPWKVKDKFALRAAETIYDKRKALVYNCLEKPETALDINEFQYVLFCIRNQSLDYVTQYDVTCDHCKKGYVVDVNFKDVLVPRFGDYTEIKTSSHTFELQEIKNQGYYEEAMQNETDPERRFLLDLTMHIASIDGDASFKATEVLDFIQELSMKEFEDLSRAWKNQRFSFNIEARVKCPFCSEYSLFRFLTVPNFFPESWENEN